MRQRIPAWAWLPIGVALGLAVARLGLAPRILARSPASGASVPSTSEIRISFNQAMDEGSVAPRLHVDSAGGGEIFWEGATLIYQPSQAWVSGSRVEVRLDSGARSRRGLSTVLGTRWSFLIAPPRLVYLWPADGPAQVYARVSEEDEPVPLTAAPEGVVDFSLGARGTRLAYAAVHGDGSTELRELDLARGQDRLLFACPTGERCASPALSPDGNRLAFVRAPSQAESGGASQQGMTRVWLLTEGDETPVLVSPEGDIASLPFWSPQGWLAFVDSTRTAILVVNAAQGEPFVPLAVLPSRQGERGTWSPDGASLIYPDLMLPQDETSTEPLTEEGPPTLETHLFRWDVASGALTDLSAASELRVEDASPTFTPQGDWIIFGRRLLSQAGWTPGRQLWRMRPDGSQAELLTGEAFINHGAPAVGPQGTMLAYLRFDLEAPLDPAQIWWFDLDTFQGSRAVEGGYLPAWIP